MATFQFYKKDAVTQHLDMDSSSFLVEKDQLVEQGFERIGDVVQAENSQLAHQKFKNIHLDELQNFTHTYLFFGAIMFLGSIFYIVSSY